MDFKENQEFIWLEDESGNRNAYVQFHSVGEDLIELDHTVVTESLRGKGIAGELLLKFSKKLERENKKVIPTCWYAADWYQKHEAFRHLVKH